MGRAQRSVARDGRVDFGGPGEDTAAKIRNLAETGLAEEVDGLRGTLAALAVRNDFARGIEFMNAARELAERDQVSVQIADLIFVGLADIQDEDIVSAIEPFLQFAGSNFRDVEIGLGFFFAANAAELVVVDELVNRAMAATHRAVRILAEFELAKLHGESVKKNQPAFERIALADDELDGFEGLERANDARKHTEDATFGARGDQAGRGWLGIEAAVARAIGHAENGDLTFEAEDGAVNIGLAEEDAGVVDEVTSGEIVGAIDDDVIVLEEFEGVGAGELGLVSGDTDVGIEIGEARLGGFGFGLADVAGAEGDLALEIREVDDVEINETDVADARGGEIEAKRRAEAAGADEKGFGAFEFELTFHAHLRHDEVAAVAEDFFVSEARCRRSAGQRLLLSGHVDSPVHSLLGREDRWKKAGDEILRFAQDDAPLP